jgi:hypothetical protein
VGGEPPEWIEATRPSSTPDITQSCPSRPQRFSLRTTIRPSQPGRAAYCL